MATAQCSRCGKAVPAGNLTVHELRCASPRAERPRLATNVAKGCAAAGLASGADDAGGTAGAGWRIDDDGAVRPRGSSSAEAAAACGTSGGPCTDNGPPADGQGAPPGPPAGVSVAGGAPGLERPREEEEEEEQRQERRADTGAPCPDCQSPLEWSDYSRGQYRHGWGCNTCSASSFGAGRHRWFCQRCQNDICERCEARQMGRLPQAATDAAAAPAAAPWPAVPWPDGGDAASAAAGAAVGGLAGLGVYALILAAVLL